MGLIQYLKRNSTTYQGAILTRIKSQNKEEMLHSIQENTDKVNNLMEELSREYNMNTTQEFTEKDLIYYLYLNPVDYIDDSNQYIMESTTAKKFFTMGILTNGAGEGLKPQYRLTAYGRNYIKNAIDLEMLS